MTEPVKKKNKRNKKKPQPPGGPVAHLSQSLDGCYDEGLHSTSTFPHQVASLLSLCFPPECKITIHQCVIRNIATIFSLDLPPGIQDMDSILACVAGGVREARQVHTSSIPHEFTFSVIQPVSITHEVHDAVLIDCVLSCRRKKSRQTATSTFSETLAITLVSSSFITSGFDHLFRTLLVYIPLAGIFYTTARSLSTNSSLSYDLSAGHTPLPFSWLRLRYTTGQPALGSFIKRINRCWKIDFTNNSNSIVHHCIQFSDKEDSTPLVPPDVIGGNSIPDVKAARARYRELLQKASSNRFGCRRYVRNAFHQLLPQTCLVYDQVTNGDAIFQVTTRDDNGRPETQSLVKVTSLTCGSPFLLSLESGVSHFLKRKGRPGNTRYHCGDTGHMNGIGVLSARTSGGNTESNIGLEESSFTQVLPDICKLANQFCNDKYPGVIPLIHHLETSSGLIRPHYLGGVDGVSSSMALSLDLVNSTHYDVNDGSVGFFFVD